MVSLCSTRSAGMKRTMAAWWSTRKVVTPGMKVATPRTFPKATGSGGIRRNKFQHPTSNILRVAQGSTKKKTESTKTGDPRTNYSIKVKGLEETINRLMG